MDPRHNPYAPGAGTRPPALTGRDQEIQAYEILIDRLKDGMAGQSMIVTGLRGVGKTVLLNAFEDITVDRGWIAVQREFDERTSLPAVVARAAQRILLDLRPSRKVAEKIRGSFAGLGMFSLKDPAGWELGYTPSNKASSDALGEDFVELLLALGQAAREKSRGVAFLLDEVQFVPPGEFGAFVVGLHRLNQKALPITCIATGLPSLPALAGEAKSYAERLFEYPRIDRLSERDAAAALRGPAESRKVSFEEDALSYICHETEGYPYFLQQYGKYAWDVASEGRITMGDARLGGYQAQERLDEGFFLVRYERATTAQRGFLRAMARCDGPPYPIADVARALGKTDQRSISMKRNALIKKGLIYVPQHGTVDYTVPRFADYLRRRDGAD
ncbi:MAG: ATP-binding protein [Solirubrobacteraceae bacterium]